MTATATMQISSPAFGRASVEVRNESVSQAKFYDHKVKMWKTVLENMYPEKFPICSKFIVTPEWAEDVLQKHNPVNRRIERRRVKKYAQDMIDGKWEINNDDICFSKDGKLINGQHRLAAVVESKCNVMMSFKFGIDESVIMTMDEGRTRSNSDVLTICGMDGNKSTLSCTNYILEQSGKKETMPRGEALAFHDRHYEVAKIITDRLFKAKSPFRKAPIGAALIRAYYHFNDQRERLMHFINILDTGLYDGIECPGPALNLRNLILTKRVGTSGPDRESLYRKTESAIDYFMRKQNLANLVGRHFEQFPLPEEEIKD